MANPARRRGPLASLLHILLVLAGVYALVCVAFWLFQARLLYYPGPPPATTPASANLEHRELLVDTPDGARLHAWLIQPRDNATPRGVVLLSHGNGGSIDLRLGHAEVFADMGLATLLYDYRGYGASTGRTDEEGTYVDAVTLHDHLTRVEGFEPLRIVAFGESLGGAVAIELARRREVAAVVVEDSFTSIPDVGAKFYPWLPIRLLSRARYDSLSKVGGLRAPILVIHSPDDELVPFEHGERLFAAAAGRKQFLRTEGGHNAGGFQRRAAWIAEVRAFLESAL